MPEHGRKATIHEADLRLGSALWAKPGWTFIRLLWAHLERRRKPAHLPGEQECRCGRILLMKRPFSVR